jgi:hypothetical protein
VIRVTIGELALMSMAHFCPQKTRYMTPEASAIKPMHVTAISDSHHDWRTRADERGSFLPTENAIYDTRSISNQTHARYSD